MNLFTKCWRLYMTSALLVISIGNYSLNMNQVLIKNDNYLFVNTGTITGAKPIQIYPCYNHFFKRNLFDDNLLLNRQTYYYVRFFNTFQMLF